MRSIENFGTEQHPIRASSLQTLVKCTMYATLKHLEGDTESGIAADTGSAMHKAAATWHTNGQDQTNAVQIMYNRREDYPLADMLEAEKMFRHYARDPRNKEANIIDTEEEVKIEIDPHPSDKTQQKVIIIGHFDQVRLVHNIYKVYDIKTSKYDGEFLSREYLYQMAAYCKGASIKYGVPVEPGAFILPRKYITKDNLKVHAPLNAYYHFSWSFNDVDIILGEVAHTVARIRNGDIYLNPGMYCNWCPARGIDVCIPKLKRMKNERS